MYGTAIILLKRQEPVVYNIDKLILMPFLEQHITMPVIKTNIKYFMLLVKFNILGAILNTQNMKETNLYSNNSYKFWLGKSFASK